MKRKATWIKVKRKIAKKTARKLRLSLNELRQSHQTVMNQIPQNTKTLVSRSIALTTCVSIECIVSSLLHSNSKLKNQLKNSPSWLMLLIIRNTMAHTAVDNHLIPDLDRRETRRLNEYYRRVEFGSLRIGVVAPFIVQYNGINVQAIPDNLFHDFQFLESMILDIINKIRNF